MTKNPFHSPSFPVRYCSHLHFISRPACCLSCPIPLVYFTFFLSSLLSWSISFPVYLPFLLHFLYTLCLFLISSSFSILPHFLILSFTSLLFSLLLFSPSSHLRFLSLRLLFSPLAIFFSFPPTSL